MPNKKNGMELDRHIRGCCLAKKKWMRTRIKLAKSSCPFHLCSHTKIKIIRWNRHNRGCGSQIYAHPQNIQVKHKCSTSQVYFTTFNNLCHQRTCIFLLHKKCCSLFSYLVSMFLVKLINIKHSFVICTFEQLVDKSSNSLCFFTK